jgi:hypothetical protein
VISHFSDTSSDIKSGEYKMMYRSPRMGLMNCWDFWLRNDSVGVIHILGTAPSVVSWLENFYSAMVPATGSVKINDSTTFEYKLAESERAYVHVGWLTGLAHLAPDILQKINYWSERGVKEFLITGHSQGGGISFMLTSYLHYLQKQQKLSSDLNFKTYSSGAPKPGNLYYAYDYDFITRNGKAFRVVNAADWVPEGPFSIQTINDFNEVNPFTNAKPTIKKQKFFVRLYMNHVYRRLNGSTKKAMKTFRKFLGKQVFKQVKKTLSQYREPQYCYSFDFSPAGVPIILLPDEQYKNEFKFDGKNIFLHHMLKPYKDLLKRQYLK